MLPEWMDPHLISTLAFSLPTNEERERPPLSRYGCSWPPKGRIGIFAGSWYSDPIRERIEKTLSLKELEARADQINRFGAVLVNEGALMLKFWFHLSKGDQRKRLKNLEQHPAATVGGGRRRRRLLPRPHGAVRVAFDTATGQKAVKN